MNIKKVTVGGWKSNRRRIENLCTNKANCNNPTTTIKHFELKNNKLLKLYFCGSLHRRKREIQFRGR